MARYDTAELITTIQRRGRVPINSGDWDATAILAEATEESLPVFSALIASKADTNVLISSVAISQGVARYRVPSRAQANGIREVWFEDANSVRQPINEVGGEELTLLRSDMATQGTPKRYWLDGGAIMLHPVPQSGVGTLKIRYHPRPSKLVTGATTFLTITGIARSNILATISFAAAPASFNNVATVDLVRGTTPFDIMSDDITISSPITTGATSALFPIADVPSDLAIGDLIHLPGESSFLNMPESLWLPVALNTAASIISAQGDRAGAKDLRDEAGRKLAAAMIDLQPRSKGNSRRLNNHRWFGR